MEVAGWLIAILVLVVSSVFLGLVSKADAQEPLVIERVHYSVKEIPEYVDRPVIEVVEKPVYIDRPVYIEIEKIVEKAVESQVAICTEDLKGFDTLEELQDWVEKWQYEPVAEWTNDGNGTLVRDTQANDCDDYSFQMIDDAVHDGYIMGLVLDKDRAHLFVCTVIGNTFYFVEPQVKQIFRVLGNSYWVIDRE